MMRLVLIFEAAMMVGIVMNLESAKVMVEVAFSPFVLPSRYLFRFYKHEFAEYQIYHDIVLLVLPPYHLQHIVLIRQYHISVIC